MKSRLVRQRHVLPLLLFVSTFASEPIFAQSASTETELFQARVSATAQKLGDQPGFKNLSPKQRDQLAEFVTGNVLFVLLHELGHAAITRWGCRCLEGRKMRPIPSLPRD